MPLLTRRELSAAVVAPLAAPVGYWIGATAFGFARWLRQRKEFGLVMPPVGQLVRPLGVILIVGAPIAWAAAAAGLPLYLAVRGAGAGGGAALGTGRRVGLLAASAAIGLVVARLMQPNLGRDLFRIPFPLWAGALLGLVVGIAFLRLAGR